VKISSGRLEFEREPLAAPFGFKGNHLDELWQVAVKLLANDGAYGVGLGVQSVLWSDSTVFAENPPVAGNAMMLLTAANALAIARDIEWENPVDLLEQILPRVVEQAKRITNRPDLRLTFALNALVAVDNAAWQLHARSAKCADFDAMIPARYRSSLVARQRKLAAIPLVTYGMGISAILDLVRNGSFFLKIKIGCDPDGDGDREKMLEWDKRRLSEIHAAVKDISTPWTESGAIPYYLDANGRYDSMARLEAFLEYAGTIGALERILILEEPFPEEFTESVSHLPVRIAADESAHSDQEAEERIALGYRAIALKPIAKTLSMSLKIAKIAESHAVPCFCADLTVNPILVDWNKNVAARLALLPGMRIGVLESNGPQNYRNWARMEAYHPCFGRPWTQVRNGTFELDDDFYAASGGIFIDGPHVLSLFK
jgi:L-alanine-DL-glutamate epimerase-like enolase superfamily enzyme